VRSMTWRATFVCPHNGYQLVDTALDGGGGIAGAARGGVVAVVVFVVGRGGRGEAPAPRPPRPGGVAAASGARPTRCGHRQRGRRVAGPCIVYVLLPT